MCVCACMHAHNTQHTLYVYVMSIYVACFGGRKDRAEMTVTAGRETDGRTDGLTDGTHSDTRR